MNRIELQERALLLMYKLGEVTKNTQKITVFDKDGKHSGFVVYSVIAAIFTGVTALLGTDTVNSIRGGLYVFASYSFALFTIIYIFSALISYFSKSWVISKTDRKISAFSIGRLSCSTT